MLFSDKEVFSITPVIAGAGRGTGQILAGIALVATAIVFAPAAGGFRHRWLRCQCYRYYAWSNRFIVGSVGLSLTPW